MVKNLTFDKEVDRVDRLLSKWGICVGNLGDARSKRRELAVTLARCHPGVFQEVVFEALSKEGRLRGLKAVQLWMYGLLSDEVERSTYLPEILREAARTPERGAGEPGYHMRIKPGTRAYLEKQAAERGVSLEQEIRHRRKAWMYARLTGDRWEIKQIADESQVTEELCRSEIGEEMKAQRGLSLEEWEAWKSRRESIKNPTHPGENMG